MSLTLTTTTNLFSLLTDDILLQIFHKLHDDPRHWARLSSVSSKFSSLIRSTCYKSTCSRSLPHDLLSSSSSWSSLHKLSVCCPGPLHAGLLLDTSDFGLQIELGPDLPLSNTATAPSLPTPTPSASASASCWSLYDDLYFDTLYDPSESEPQQQQQQQINLPENLPEDSTEEEEEEEDSSAIPCNKKRKVSNSSCCTSSQHLATGTRNLSREQGSKLLARQFRDDCLYICDWPGCVHWEEGKRKYRVFRGIFKDFKRTRVWRTINDGKRKRVDLGCAYCRCDETWDLQSAFCLRRSFGYHDDGEPVVRAFVCENGHVSGAWTDLPIYT